MDRFKGILHTHTLLPERSCLYRKEGVEGCGLNRYDKALMAAVAIGIIGILITILPPLEDIGLGLGLFICAVFASRYILIKSSLREKSEGD